MIIRDPIVKALFLSYPVSPKMVGWPSFKLCNEQKIWPWLVQGLKIPLRSFTWTQQDSAILSWSWITGHPIDILWVLSVLSSRSIYKAGFRPDVSQKMNPAAWKSQPITYEVETDPQVDVCHSQHHRNLRARAAAGLCISSISFDSSCAARAGHMWKWKNHLGWGQNLFGSKLVSWKKKWVDEHPTYRSYFDVPQTIPRFWAI